MSKTTYRKWMDEVDALITKIEQHVEEKTDDDSDFDETDAGRMCEETLSYLVLAKDQIGEEV